MEEFTRKEEQVLLAIHFLKDNAMLNTIQKRIKQFTGKEYSLGTIYVPLNRLHMKGYLSAEQKKVHGSNKPVRYYTITESGYKALAELKRRTDEMWIGFSNPAIEDADI
ncbi:PadR family transcriptional regulator [candidate division KSB1 bacterium]